jgi:tousled-like kinase
VIRGLLALRSEAGLQIIHYDLKPGNILFGKNSVVKVSDFGLSKVVEEDQTQLELTSQGTGTFYYAPPETMRRGQRVMINASCDTWSIGIIFFECLFGRRPWGDGMGQVAFAAQVESVTEQLVFPPTPRITEGAKDFIMLCLQKDPRVRPTLEALNAVPYLTITKEDGKSRAGAASKSDWDEKRG